MSLLRARASNCSRQDDFDPNEEHEHNAKPGQLIVIQEKYNALKPVTLAEGAILNNRYGRFAHDDIIDLPLGRRIKSKSVNTGRHSSAGFVHALAPTPELWSQAMDHRTQIVYPHDAALIALLLDLRPGSVLVESGTGSGSASAAFARVVAPGKVYSFDFHSERATAASQDFARLGIDSVISVKGGVDVVKEGFVGVPNAAADAVFLDLPVPYVMGEEVRRVLREDGVVCAFSPCIEQVQRTCQMLRKDGFHSIRTVTAPVKTYETREMKLETPGFDDLAINRSSDSPTKKRRRLENGAKAVSEKDLRIRNRSIGAERIALGERDGESHVGRVMRPKVLLHSKPFSSMKGHTSYLTFARRSRDPLPLNGVHVADAGVKTKGTSERGCQLL